MQIFKHKTLGHLVELSPNTDPKAEIVRFFRQGGGFERSMHSVPFYQFYEPAPGPVMVRGTITADFLPDGVTLPCWSDGRAWNGWGMPYFERSTVERLRGLLRDVGGSPLEWDGDKIIARMGDDPDEIEIYEPTTAPDGSQVWGIGAGSWTWDSVNIKGTE